MNDLSPRTLTQPLTQPLHLPRKAGQRFAKRTGTVLIAIVVIVMLLSLAAYKYMLTMQTEHMAAAISGDRLQAQQAAYSARDLLALMLESPRSKRDEMGGLVDNPVYFGGLPTALNSTSTLSGGSSFSRTSSAVSSSLSTSTTGSSDAVSGLQPEAFGTIAYALPVSAEAKPFGAGSSYGTTSRSTAMSYGSQPSSSQPSSSQTLDSATSSLGPPTRYGVKNESAKLHLSTVLEMESNGPGLGVEALMQLPGMTQTVAESILDWIDKDDEPRNAGAESEFYSTLVRPMAPRNNLPPDIDELLFVKGVTPFELFGIRTEANPFSAARGTLDSQSSAFGMSGAFGLSGLPASSAFKTNSSASFSNSDWSGSQNDGTTNSAMGPMRAWSELLTVYSAERNESYTGEPRLFLNMKDIAKLHSSLLRTMPTEMATFIVLYRQYGPSEQNVEAPAGEASTGEVSTGEFETIGNASNEDLGSVTIDFEKAGKVAITNPLDLIATAVTIPAQDEDEEPLTFASPFGRDVAEIAPEFIDLLDRVTVNSAPRIVGRVNINEAPAEVLMALPGTTETIVDAILADRETSSGAMYGAMSGISSGALSNFASESTTMSGESTKRLHPIWLLNEGIVDEATMRLLWPYVTCGGDVFRAEIWGNVDQRSPSVRFETVLDASLKKCVSVYYRELSAPKHTIQLKAPAELVAEAAGKLNER